MSRVVPRLEGRDLEGTRVVVPDDLTGDRNVLLVAFRREHQALVDSWVPWLDARAGDDPGLRYYELPTIGLQWSPGRRVIDGGMAAAIPDPAVRQRTFTIYTDVRRVTTALGLTTTRTIAVVLVDRAGRVLWQGSGPCSEDAGTALRRCDRRRAKRSRCRTPHRWGRRSSTSRSTPGTGGSSPGSGSRRRLRT